MTAAPFDHRPPLIIEGREGTTAVQAAVYADVRLTDEQQTRLGLAVTAVVARHVGKAAGQ